MGSILSVILGVFEFFKQVTWLIKLLQGTPEAHREDIMKAIQKEAEQFKLTGRPTWE